MYVPKRKGEQVLVYVDGGYEYGVWTGRHDDYDEHFEIQPESKRSPSWFHYEDIKEP